MFTIGSARKWAAKMRSQGAEIRVIGYSAFGREIIAARAGDGKKRIIATAAIHARENVTASLVAEAALNYTGNATVWFIPLVNPDGAELVAQGAAAFGGAGEYLIALNGGSCDFQKWKANARGVDLNVNFDAKFGKGRQNVFSPAPENYVGEYPFSEPETAALCDFTLSVTPDLTLSYHAKGQIVYWYFGQSGSVLSRDRKIASAAAKTLGYALAPAQTDSAGGYKDWCVQTLKIPALTIETVSDSFTHPLPQNAVTVAEKRRNFALVNTIERFL